MHTNMLMLHIVHNVWQISHLMEWMNTWNVFWGMFFFFFYMVKVFYRLLKVAWVSTEYIYIGLMLSFWTFHFFPFFFFAWPQLTMEYLHIKTSHWKQQRPHLKWHHVHKWVSLLLYMLAGRKSSDAPPCSHWHAHSCGAPVCSESWIPVWWCSPWGGPLETPLDGGHMVQRWKTPDSLWCPSCVCSTW